MQTEKSLDAAVAEVFTLLKKTQQVLVAAESCTAGLIAATLARMPGMSAYLAGSFVVYQVDSKVAWLGVPPELIREHDVVSAEVAECMASQALKKTIHATAAISITGHLGPNAPRSLDGVAWIGWAARPDFVRSQKLILDPETLEKRQPEHRFLIRHQRQENAVLQSLGFLRDRLAEMA
jgi:PncC family amidohydrolase